MSTELLIHAETTKPGPSSAVMVIEEFEEPLVQYIKIETTRAISMVVDLGPPCEEIHGPRDTIATGNTLPDKLQGLSFFSLENIPCELRSIPG